jgi:hypothetical protein
MPRALALGSDDFDERLSSLNSRRIAKASSFVKMAAPTPAA